MSSAALVFLVLRPTLSQLYEYAAYARFGFSVTVIVDDNTYIAPPVEGLAVLQLNDYSVACKGFYNFNPAIVKPSRCSAWDKAVYALNYIIFDYRFCWILEEDVFVPEPGALVQIDLNYPIADLLVGSSDIILPPRLSGSVTHWPWARHIPSLSSLSVCAHGMVCASRFSKHLMQAVGEFISQSPNCFERHNKMIRFFSRLFGRLRLSSSLVGCEYYPFIEFIFHSVALSGGYTIEVPDELSGILWRHDWEPEAMLPTHLYHPVKVIADHPRLREQIARRQS
jgi:hypothetical protein